MKKLKTALQSRYLFKILSLFFLAYSLTLIIFYPFKSIYDEDTNTLVGNITQYRIDGNLLKAYLKGKETVIVNYYFESEEEKAKYQNSLELGDKLEVKGELVEPSENTVPNLFNYKKYLQYKKIFYLFKASSIKKVSNNTSVFYCLKNLIIKRISKIDKTGYLKTFILGDKTEVDSDVISNYQTNGISHLFSISGMHVNLIVSLVLAVLKKISYNQKYKYSIVIAVLLLYLFLTGVSASILRTTTMFILLAINRCYNLKIKKFDIMFIVLIVLIIINPFIICDIGFQFSYSISLTLVLLSKKINSLKNKLLKNLYISYVCFLISFPICIYYFYQVNVLSILFNLFMIPFVSIIVFPLTLIVFIIPMFYPLYQVVITLLENINTFLSNINCLEIIFAKPNLLVIIIYYLVIFLSLYKKKYIPLLIIVMVLHKSLPYLDSSFTFTMIDVGQGDSLLIKLPNNEGNILVDTGGSVGIKKEAWQIRKSQSNLAESRIIPYMKSLGISQLDYVIFTHGDADHMGEGDNLLKNFKVSKVIFNIGQYNTLETNLVELLTTKNIKYYNEIDELLIGKNKLTFLNSKIYDNENDNSNVIYFVYNNYKFLLMGDASIKKETDILNKYNLNNITFLKIGHHGSDTSSGETFIKKINPQNCFISVGKNNRYGHPKQSVLDTLKKCNVYRTDINGSVVVKINNDNYEIKTCN